MPAHVSEASHREDNLPTRPARIHWVQKVLSPMGSAFNEREPGTVSDDIFRGTSASRAPCQRDEYRECIDWDESWFYMYYDYAHDSAWALSRATLRARTSSKIQMKR
jgi:hypothetical protein